MGFPSSSSIAKRMHTTQTKLNGVTDAIVQSRPILGVIIRLDGGCLNQYIGV